MHKKEQPGILDSMEKLKFIDLFAGVGGMRLAFENAGMECVFSCEQDKFCQETYKVNFGEIPTGDIRTVNAETIPDHDVLVAGFPCQPFSLAGVSKKNHLGRPHGFKDKTSGTLFFEVARILEEKRPPAFLLENVKNLVSHDGGNTFRIILETLDELDYSVFWKIIDARHYVPQHRERIFICGFDRKRFGDNIKFDMKIPVPERKPKFKDILDSGPSVQDFTISDKLWNYLQAYAKKQKEKGNGFGYGLAPLDGVTRTISARYYKDGAEILVPQEGKNPRRLTLLECRRLQGFPDDFILPCSKTQSYKQMGNSVAVPVVSELASKLSKSLQEFSKKHDI